jgi:hypothetical protein
MERETWREVCERTGETGNAIEGARMGADSFSMRA